MFLLQTLHRLTTLPALEDPRSEHKSSSKREAKKKRVEKIGDGEQSNPENVTHALEMPEGQMLAKHTRVVFRCWVLLFALVGAQMGWVLRPFVGRPQLPFTWFRERKSNVFSGVLNALNSLLFGGG